MVKHRCNGVCERCKKNPMQEVHHLTYARLGNEPIEDLLGVCRQCHKYIHRLSKYDPLCPLKDIDEILRKYLDDL